MVARGKEWANGVLGRLKPGCCGPNGVRMVQAASLVSIAWEEVPSSVVSGVAVSDGSIRLTWTRAWHGFRILVVRQWRRELSP